MFTFDLDNSEDMKSTYGLIRSLFERLGWEHLGGTAYRYPRLQPTDHPVEDWFNQVVPALMGFRLLVLESGVQVKKWALQADSSSGFNLDGPIGQIGAEILAGKDVPTSNPQGNKAFGKKKLVAFLDGNEFPYKAP